MILKNRSIDHSKDEFFACVEPTGVVYKNARERIFFYTFVNALLCFDMYEEVTEAPMELRSSSGDLQTILKAITDPLEYELTLLMFFKYHEMALAAFKLYRINQKIEEHSEDISPETKLKMSILKHALDLKAKADSMKESKVSQNFEVPVEAMNPGSLISRIKLCKDSNYNWEKYLRLLNGDDFVNKALNNIGLD
jgi:hypothetical protein